MVGEDATTGRSWVALDKGESQVEHRDGSNDAGNNCTNLGRAHRLLPSTQLPLGNYGAIAQIILYEIKVPVIPEGRLDNDENPCHPLLQCPLRPLQFEGSQLFDFP